jgi:hypothetical protein
MNPPRDPLATALRDSPVIRYPELLAAAIADPDSDAARQALADALRADGDAFASVIEQQLAWASLDAGARDRNRRSLEASDAILRHHTALHRAVAGDGRVGDLDMERGLVEHARRIPLDELIADADALFGSTALRSVDLFPANDATLAVLAALPQAAALRHIRVCDPAVGDAGVDALLSSPILSGLRSLKLHDVNLSDATLQRLAENATFMLELLSMSDTRLPPGAVEALANGARMTALRTLILGGRRVDAAAQRTLAASRSLRLRELWLIGNRLDHGLEALAGSPAVAGLEALVLGDECSDPSALASLLGSLDALQRLRVERCAEGTLVAEALRPSAGTLRELSLYGVELGDAGARTLCELGLGGLCHLELTMSGIGDAGARALAASGLLRGLTRLSFWDSRLGPDGVQAIAGVSPDLVELVLSGNPIGDEGARILAASPALRNLERLLLTSTGIGPEGARALLDAPGLARAHTIVLPREVGSALRAETMARRRDFEVVVPGAMR